MFIILIIPLLRLWSKSAVPLDGSPKNPIAELIPNSPVVFGSIKQFPVSDLNCRYSAAYPVRLTPEFIHFVLGRSYVRKSPFAKVPRFTSSKSSNTNAFTWDYRLVISVFYVVCSSCILDISVYILLILVFCVVYSNYILLISITILEIGVAFANNYHELLFLI